MSQKQIIILSLLLVLMPSLMASDCANIPSFQKLKIWASNLNYTNLNYQINTF